MKPTSRLRLLLTMLLAAAVAELRGDTELFPGVTLHAPPEILEGQLAMLVEEGTGLSGAGLERRAAIFAFDLGRKTLRKITDVPQFNGFSASPDGQVFCVADGPYTVDRAKMFLHSERLHVSRSIPLPRGPKLLFLMGDHALFVLGQTNGSCLFHYDLAADRLAIVKVPTDTAWEYQEYADLSGPREAVNILHFSFQAHRGPSGNVSNFTRGSYSYNLQSGKVERIVSERDIKPISDRAKNGRYVFFYGAGAPVAGTRLVSSPVDYLRLQDADKATRVDVRTLHRFRNSRPNDYELLQLSPCGKYALVQLAELVGPRPGIWVYSYYVVDVADGSTTLILKNGLQLKTGRRMWQRVYWTCRGDGR